MNILYKLVLNIVLLLYFIYFSFCDGDYNDPWTIVEHYNGDKKSILNENRHFTILCTDNMAAPAANVCQRQNSTNFREDFTDEEKNMFNRCDNDTCHSNRVVPQHCIEKESRLILSSNRIGISSPICAINQCVNSSSLTFDCITNHGQQRCLACSTVRDALHEKCQAAQRRIIATIIKRIRQIQSQESVTNFLRDFKNIYALKMLRGNGCINKRRNNLEMNGTEKMKPFENKLFSIRLLKKSHDDQGDYEIKTNGGVIRISSETRRSVDAVVATWKGLSHFLQQNAKTTCPEANLGECQYFTPSNVSLRTVNYYHRENYTAVSGPVNYTLDLRGDRNLFALVDGRRRRLRGVLPPKCVFWNGARWSDRGCVRVIADGEDDDRSWASEIRCSCNHTTTFFALLAIDVTVEPDWYQPLFFALESTSVAFLVLAASLLALAQGEAGSKRDCTAAVRSREREWRRNRGITQISMCVALALFGAVLIFADAATPNTDPVSCYATAAAAHFTLLAAAFWLVTECVTLTLKTTDVALTLDYGRLTTVQMACGWLLPIAVVATCAAITGKDYVANSRGSRVESDDDVTNPTLYPRFDECTPSTVYGGIIAPVTAVVFVNMTLITRMAVVVYRSSRSISHFHRKDVGAHAQHWRSAAKTVCLMTPVSAVPWILWFMSSVFDRGTAFGTVVLVAICSQGTCIFVIFCLVRRDDRARIARALRRSGLFVPRFSGKNPGERSRVWSMLSTSRTNAKSSEIGTAV